MKWAIRVIGNHGTILMNEFQSTRIKLFDTKLDAEREAIRWNKIRGLDTAFVVEEYEEGET